MEILLWDEEITVEERKSGLELTIKLESSKVEVEAGSGKKELAERVATALVALGLRRRGLGKAKDRKPFVRRTPPPATVGTSSPSSSERGTRRLTPPPPTQERATKRLTTPPPPQERGTSTRRLTSPPPAPAPTDRATKRLTAPPPPPPDRGTKRVTTSRPAPDRATKRHSPK